MSARQFIFSASFLLVFAYGCASKPAVLDGFETRPTQVSFQVVDERPEGEKSWERLSGLITSCDYEIHRVGDDQTVPSRMDLLRQDLELALGTRLSNTALTVSSYRIFLNAGARVRNGVVDTFGGVVAPIMAGMGSNCSKEETTDGWYAASELTRPTSPFIIEIEAKFEGHSYSVRTVYSPEVQINGFKLDDPPAATALFQAMHQANARLTEEMRLQASKPN